MKKEPLSVIREIVLQSGAYFKELRPLPGEVETKEGRANFVTLYDRNVQKMIRRWLEKEFPDCGFIGEEDGSADGILPEKCFIVDPIDGTANFVSGCKHSAVSVAYVENGIPLAGAVYDPYLDELFTAEKGKGAFLNGQPIHVSERKLREATVIFGASPYDPALADRTFRILRKLYENAADLRNTGSAALDICYVASGKADIFFELLLCPWDYAAAGLILEEAGGVIRNCEGGEVSLTGKSSVAATSFENYSMIRDMLD